MLRDLRCRTLASVTHRAISFNLCAASGWLPDLVLASNARRTRQTLEAMAGVLGELRGVDTHLYGCVTGRELL
jgi:phosphohistidine phosphatase SixA